MAKRWTIRRSLYSKYSGSPRTHSYARCCAVPGVAIARIVLPSVILVIKARSSVSTDVGPRLGASVGTLDGEILGEDEGRRLGGEVGGRVVGAGVVGLDVGNEEGISVGLAEGNEEGSSVGGEDASPVGESVARPTSWNK